MTKRHFRTTVLALLFVFSLAFLGSGRADAQVRGQYAPGINATNSGSDPEPGFTYANIFAVYSFNKLVGPNGQSLTFGGKFSIKMDLNVFFYVPRKKILGAKYAAMAALAGASGTLTAADTTTRGTGVGFADMWVQPISLTWGGGPKSRVDTKAGFGFTAPTGRYTAGAHDNTGSGYWGYVPFAGQTFYLTKNKGTAISAYEQYEFHGTQKGTDIHPGQTFDIDYSVTQILPLKKDMTSLLQVGFIGYGMYQTTDKSGPGINPTIAANTHYKVNAIGAGANLILPKHKFVLGFKYFNEVANRNTVQGHSLQVNGSISF